MKTKATVEENLSRLYEECRRAKGKDMRTAFEQAYELFRQMEEEGIRVHATHTIYIADKMDTTSFLENSDGTITYSSYVIDEAGMRDCKRETSVYSPYLHLRYDYINGSGSGMVTFSPQKGERTFQGIWNNDYMADLKTLVCRPQCKAQIRLDDIQAIKDLYLVLYIVNEDFVNKPFVEDEKANIEYLIENWELRRKTF